LNPVPCDSHVDRLCLMLIHSLCIKREVICQGSFTTCFAHYTSSRRYSRLNDHICCRL
jgi:hypothetical protein